MIDHRAQGDIKTIIDALGEVGATADTILASETASDPALPRPLPAGISTGADRYEMGELLGQGGMGRVVAARDRQFGRTIAFKELLGGAPSSEAIRRFLQESVVTANLEHPGIVAVYERGVREGRPFYAMRRVDGRTLTDAIKAAGSLRERLKLLPAIVRIAHTLGFAHERGVVHRDIKPDNVVLGTHGETVLLDWGIARVRAAEEPGKAPGPAVSDSLPGGKTIAGAILGTPAYMAPEQAAGDSDAVDARTDVFALGAMLFELLAGRAPYEGESLQVVLAKALQCVHPPLSELAPSAPLALRMIVEKAMAREKGARYGAAAELATALEDFQADALSVGESRTARWFAVASGIAAVGLVVFAAVPLSLAVSTAREQGSGGLVYLPFTLLGLSLSTLEWRTHGRYAVRGLAAAIVGVTVMLGFATTAAGMSIAASALAKIAATEPLRFNGIYAEALYEALGNITYSLLYSSVQLLALALASRAADRALVRLRGKTA